MDVFNVEPNPSILDPSLGLPLIVQIDRHLSGEAGGGRGGAQDGVAMDNREALEQERVAAILEETSRAFINTSSVRALNTLTYRGLRNG